MGHGSHGNIEARVGSEATVMGKVEEYYDRLLEWDQEIAVGLDDKSKQADSV